MIHRRATAAGIRPSILGLASLVLWLLPGAGFGEDPPETVCELMATLASNWLESHESGKTVEEISNELMASFDRVGLTEDTDRGITFRTAGTVSLIGLAQNDPATPEAAAEIALETCSTWYRSRGREPYRIPERPMLWD
jgi:hypothetical protein